MTALQQEAAAPGRPRAGEAAGVRGAFGRWKATWAPHRAKAAVPLAAAVAVVAGGAALLSAAEVIAVLADAHVYVPLYGTTGAGGARWDDPGLRTASAVLLLIGGGMLVAAGARGGVEAEASVRAVDGDDPLPGLRKALEESAATVSGVEAASVRVGIRSVVVRVAIPAPRPDARRRAVEGAVRARLDSLSLGEEFSVRTVVESPVGAE